MMCSKLLRPEGSESRLTRWLDRGFASMSLRYERSLRKAIHHPVLFTSIVVATVFAAYGLMNLIPEEFAPAEDSGQVFTRVSGPEGASFPYMSEQMTKLEDSMKPWVDSGDVEQLVVALPAFGNQQANVGVMLISMAPWDKRSLTTAELLRKANAAWSDIPGVRAFPAMRSGLSGGRGSSNSPVQFVIQGSTYEELAQWRDVLLARAAEYPGIARMDHDFRETKPELVVVVDRNRAADLGVSVQSVGRTLQTMMSERNITTYVDGGEEYDVILQAKDSQRTSPQDLSNIYVRSDSSGQLIPLSNLTRIENQATAGQLNRYNRLRAVTLSGDLAPGQTLGDALAFLENVVRTELPPTAQIDYKGESLEYKESRGGLLFTFVMALLVVYLVLAAQFESFVHPLIVMLTVPLAVSGALLGLFLTGSSMNIYSQIGLVMLVGIAAKNGILIVEFANQMRDAGRAFEDALLEAAKIRLRPILMTTSATVMGSVPLMLASGPGSESRITLGVVIFWGVSITTLMTLFVVPTFYRLLARNTGSPGAVAAALEHLQPSAPRQGAPASPSGSTQA